MNKSEIRLHALSAALAYADTINSRVVDCEVPLTVADVKNAAEVFYLFLNPEEKVVGPQIRVGWRDETPSVTPLRGVTDLADHGKPIPATIGSTPLVSTTVVKANPESLREMRARAEQERRNGSTIDHELSRQKQSELDNPTEQF